MQRFASKTVLITGSTGGIGLETARRFHAEGAQLVLVDLDASLLQAQARALGPGVSVFVADVADEAAAHSVFSELARRQMRIDVGVLNAGTEGKIALIEEQALADFDRVMAVNVRGVFIWMAGLMRLMRSQGSGAITVTSSTAGLQGARLLAPYSASKHAVLGLVKSAAIEGAPAGIRVNAVNPGPVATRMMDAIDAGRGELREVQTRSAQAVPMRRYGTPAEVAAMIAFISSDDASFTTGSTLCLDGGLVAGRG